MKVEPENIAKQALFSIKGIKYQGHAVDICALTVACGLCSIPIWMDTTAFIRKINGEIARVSSTLTPSPTRHDPEALSKKPELGADRSKSKKRVKESPKIFGTLRPV
jgi:hypothetical protein